MKNCGNRTYFFPMNSRYFFSTSWQIVLQFHCLLSTTHVCFHVFREIGIPSCNQTLWFEFTRLDKFFTQVVSALSCRVLWTWTIILLIDKIAQFVLVAVRISFQISLTNFWNLIKLFDLTSCQLFRRSHNGRHCVVMGRKWSYTGYQNIEFTWLYFKTISIRLCHFTYVDGRIFCTCCRILVWTGIFYSLSSMLSPMCDVCADELASLLAERTRYCCSSFDFTLFIGHIKYWHWSLECSHASCQLCESNRCLDGCLFDICFCKSDRIDCSRSTVRSTTCWQTIEPMRRGKLTKRLVLNWLWEIN